MGWRWGRAACGALLRGCGHWEPGRRNARNISLPRMVSVGHLPAADAVVRQLASSWRCRTRCASLMLSAAPIETVRRGTCNVVSLPECRRSTYEHLMQPGGPKRGYDGRVWASAWLLAMPRDPSMAPLDDEFRLGLQLRRIWPAMQTAPRRAGRARPRLSAW